MTTITVKVIPKASKNEIIGWEEHDGNKTLKAKATVAPEKGKANKALVELLAGYFKCSKSEISLIRGATNQTKTFEIQSVK